MNFAIGLGTIVIGLASTTGPGPGPVPDLKQCVSVSGKTVQNNCSDKINFRYCTPNADGSVPRTCGTGDDDNKYYPRGFYVNVGKSRDIAIPDGDAFKYVVCPYRTYVHSDSQGGFDCVDW